MLVPKHILPTLEKTDAAIKCGAGANKVAASQRSSAQFFLVCTCAVLKLNLNMQVLLKFTIRGAKNEYREFEIRNIWAALAARDLW